MSNSYIVSQIEGRIRLRHIALRNMASAKKLEQIFSDKEGIEGFTVNTRSASALLHYDADTLNENELTKLLSQAQELLDSFCEENACTASAETTDGSCVSGFTTVSDLVKAPIAGIMNVLPQNKRERRRFLTRTMATSLLIAVLSISSERIHVFFATIFVTLGLNHVWERRKAL